LENTKSLYNFNNQNNSINKQKNTFKRWNQVKETKIKTIRIQIPRIRRLTR